jgi:ElaB/YqjD/DUF883 family membrane-anchored ribosome-binding protein
VIPKRPAPEPLQGGHRFSEKVYAETIVVERVMASTDGAAGTVEDIQRDVKALRDDLAKLAGQVSELLSAGGSEAIAGLKERVYRVQDGLGETASDMGERGREALSDVSEHLSEALQQSIEEHPLTTIALAVGLGFFVGTAWRR